MPNELERILRENGVKDIQLAGPGAYARTIPNELLRKIMSDPAQKSAFLNFCHRFDQNPYVCGMGKDNLFAKGVVACGCDQAERNERKNGSQSQQSEESI